MYFKTIGKEVAVDLKSLQTELTNFNRFLHRLYMALDSIEYILSPYDALQLANDYIMIKRFKFRLNRRTVSYLDDKESKFYLNICNDIISNYIEEYLTGNEEKILCIDGARQVGKSYIIRELAQKHFENYIEINMADDKVGDKLFANVRTVESFYIEVSVIAGDKLKDRENTIIFIDKLEPHTR